MIGLVELAFVLNAVRLLILATYTEPGIIPRITSNKIDYNRTHYVEYKSMEEIASDPAYQDLTPGQAFFSVRKFKYV